jgi:hypothetical protein
MSERPPSSWSNLSQCRRHGDASIGRLHRVGNAEGEQRGRNPAICASSIWAHHGSSEDGHGWAGDPPEPNFQSAASGAGVDSAPTAVGLPGASRFDAGGNGYQAPFRLRQCDPYVSTTAYAKPRQMRGALVLLLLSGCAVSEPPPAAPVARRYIPVGRCPTPPRLPVPPGKIRTIEEVAAWARRVVSAYEEIEADRDECARSLGQLERMIGDE